MRYLHTMVRVVDLEVSLRFYRDILGMVVTRRTEQKNGRFTLVYLTAPGDRDGGQPHDDAPQVELTFNWDPEAYTGGRNFGHLAFEVDDIYAFCDSVVKAGLTVNRPPRDGRMAFIRSPDGISVELLQKGGSLEPKEPWVSMPNTGSW